MQKSIGNTITNAKRKDWRILLFRRSAAALQNEKKNISVDLKFECEILQSAKDPVLRDIFCKFNYGNLFGKLTS